MKKIVLFSILLIFSFSLAACSKPVTSADESQSLERNTVNAQKGVEEFKKRAGEKGLTESKVHTLGNLGYLEQEILNLSSDKIAEIFAPGATNDGAPLFMANDKQIEELKEVSIDSKMSAILGNLGYTYDKMLRLSPNEVDFVFPNTELMANLAQKGFSEQEVQSWLDKGKTYKEVIREALISMSVTGCGTKVIKDVNKTGNINLQTNSEKVNYNTKEVDITYMNEKCGFTLDFPSYWNEEYFIEDLNGMGVRIHHKDTWLKNGAGTLFQITVFDKSKDEWNKIGKILVETVGLRKIYENDKEVFGFSCPTDVQYIPDDKDLCSQYMKMENDVFKVVETFKKIN
ncbi:hypothetical protein UF75_5321 [Desulfosporosinus sp. I2]|uniref:hypothetical protein n=1 Tax=Desulfosporosinus sp. I2 TaxID=1617025 RepID=UPI00061E4A21|nr:hypothetical protein [Desulfosporosinus sp. I2]KJR44295.1 hypothetical protein UF75_5321 [Desulfosporosinus sp. I2]